MVQTQWASLVNGMTKPIVLLGEAHGENEARLGKPFVGASGIELLRMLNEASLIELTETDYLYLSRYYASPKPDFINAIWELHPEVYRTNVFQQHPPGNKLEFFCGPKGEGIRGFGPLLTSKYVRGEFTYELERLGDELVRIDPNLVVCLGNSALWALTGSTGITKYRGSTRLSTHTASDFKLLPTYHPAAVLRQWELRPTTVIDLMKAAREGEYADIRRPKREIWIEPSLEDMEKFYETYTLKCECLSVDIETAGNAITCIGFAPQPGVALVVPFYDARKKGRNYWPDEKAERAAVKHVRKVLEDRRIRKVFQNGLYDIAFIWRCWGIRVFGAEEDTMLLHHALQPESLKSLGFLGSIYTDEGSWKVMRKVATIKRDE